MVCCFSRRMIVTDCHFFFVSIFCIVLASSVLVDCGVWCLFMWCLIPCGNLVVFCVFGLLRFVVA